MTTTRSPLATLSILLPLLAGAALPAHAETPTVQVNALFRVLKVDGVTVAGQAVVTPGGGALATVNVTQADAIAVANGRCAFNVRYDEVATAAAKGTVNRLYSNDTLVAQNSAIDLQAGVLRSITTQPYLFAGNNNLKIVVNADGKLPSVGWVRINVAGDCKTAAATPPKVEPPKPAASTPTPPPKPVVAPAVVPGSTQWNALYNAWGYSNYAFTQLKTRSYAKYAEVVALNTALTQAVNAKRIEAAACATLMARWNALANDPGFIAIMATVVPGGDRK